MRLPAHAGRSHALGRRPGGDDVVCAHRHAAGAADQGSEHVLLLHRPPHRAAVPRRGRRVVGYEHRDGHLVGAEAARPGRAHHGPALGERQGVPAAVGRPGVERRGRPRPSHRARAPHSGLRGRRRHQQRRVHPAAAVRRSRQEPRRRSTRASTASRWPSSPRPAAGVTWSSIASSTTTSPSP